MLTTNENYAWTRPALLQWKLRELELKAGHSSRGGGVARSAAVSSNANLCEGGKRLEVLSNASVSTSDLQHDM
jgi:hypothetical protein